MKKFIDENRLADEKVILAENNGPEVIVKLYDNIGIEWLYHYGKSSASSLICVDDTILQNLLDRSESSVVAKNATSKFYDIRIKNAVNSDSLKLNIEAIGLSKMGTNLNRNEVLVINDKKYDKSNNKVFKLIAQERRYLEDFPKSIELTDIKPLRYLRRNIDELKKSNALVYLTSAAMKTAFREDVISKAKLTNGEETNEIWNHKKEKIESVTFVDELYKRSYTFIADDKSTNWMLCDISKITDKGKQVLFSTDSSMFTTPTTIDYLGPVYENLANE